jgi:SAM-dependent methyltransferase
MAKAGEINYLQNMAREFGEHAVRHAVGKPFTDPGCAAYLAEVAAVIALLPPSPARVLDLGCGTGWTSMFFAKTGLEVTGVDIAPDMICHALAQRDREGQHLLHFESADYESYDGKASFDAVVFFDSLHHAVDEQAALACAYRALKPGGVCIASEPGYCHSQSEVAQHAASKWDVTEKDMSPLKIMRLGRRVGFRAARVFPHASWVHRELFRRPEFVAPAGRLRRTFGLAARVATAPLRGAVRAISLVTRGETRRWFSGITVLAK